MIKKPKAKAEATGSSWKIPYAMAKPRYDQDKKKIPCKVFDIAFHKQAFKFARMQVKFKQLLCDTSVDAANQLLRQHDEKVSQDYTVLTKFKCKGDEPGSIIVPKDRKLSQPPPTEPNPNVKTLDEEGPKLYREMMAQQAKAQAKKELTPDTESEEEAEDESWRHITGIQAPDYKILHSNKVDMGDFIVSNKTKHKRPEELVVKITVPRMEKIADADMDIDERLLILQVPETYYLEVKLPYEVEKECAKAQFDAKLKIISVRLPVVPSNEPDDEIDAQVESDNEHATTNESVEETQEELNKAETEVSKDSNENSSNKEENQTNEQEIEEIRAPQKDPKEDSEAPENQSEEVAPAATEEEKPVDEDQPKEEEPVILEEVKYKAETVHDETPTEVVVEEISSTEFVTEQPSDRFVVRDEERMMFILFHLPRVDLASVRWEVYSDEIMVKWEVDGKPEKFIRHLHAPIDPVQSGVDTVIDYISIRLFKQNATAWPDPGEEIEQLSEHDQYTTTPSKISLECTMLYEIF